MYYLSVNNPFNGYNDIYKVENNIEVLEVLKVLLKPSVFGRTGYTITIEHD